MTNKTHAKEGARMDYSEYVKNQRLLADYIKTSLWDERMNREREKWLWERRGMCAHKTKYYE